MTNEASAPATEAANDATVTTESPKSLYDLLIAAGHTENDINGHLFACACTMTLLRNAGLPAVIGVPIIARVTSEKMRIDREAALLVMGVVVAALRADDKFREGVEKAAEIHGGDISALLSGRGE